VLEAAGPGELLPEAGAEVGEALPCPEEGAAGVEGEAACWKRRWVISRQMGKRVEIVVVTSGECRWIGLVGTVGLIDRLPSQACKLIDCAVERY